MNAKKYIISYLPKFGGIVFFTILSSLFLVNAAFAGTTPTVSSATYKVGNNKIMVNFNYPVWSDAAFSTALSTDDFIFVDGSGNGTGFDSISSVTHTAGQDYVILTMNAVAVAGDSSSQIRLWHDEIFTVGGAMPGITTSLTSDTTPPTISSISSRSNSTNNKFVINFSEPVFADTNIGELSYDGFNPDFTYNNNGGVETGSISNYTVSPDRRHVFATGDGIQIAQEPCGGCGGGDDTDSVSPYNEAGVEASIFDVHGNSAVNADTLIGNTEAIPSIQSVEAVVGTDKVLVTFDAPAFGGDNCSTNLANSDFSYTNNNADGATAFGASSGTGGTKYMLLDLDAAVTATDLTNGSADEIAVAATSVYACDDDANAATGNATVVANDLDDTIDPVFLSITQGKSGGKNTLAIQYSEPVQATGFTSGGSSSASTVSVGDITSACTVVGFGSFAAGGLTYNTLKNTVALSADQKTFTITLAGQTGGFRTSSSSTDCSGTFTPTAIIRDVHDATNVIETTSIQQVITNSGDWDLANATDMSNNTFAVAQDTATTLAYSWSAEADPGDFGMYRLFYSTSDTTPTFTESVSIWDSASDADLATAATTDTTITSLATASTVYTTAYVFDTYGNPGTASSTVSSIVAAAGGSTTFIPNPPTGLAATVTAENTVKLTWTDANSTESVRIYKGTSPSPIDGGTPVAVVDNSIEEYIDADVEVGDTVSYILKTVAGNGETSGSSETVTITVETGANGEVTEPAEEQPSDGGSTEEPPATNEDLEWEEEKAKTVELGILTKELEKASNKCEALVMLARVAELAEAEGWEVDETVTEDGFDDTPLWCKPYAKLAKDLGVVEGRSETELGLTGGVNRYEIAVMLARVLGATEADLETAAELDLYEDEIVDWARGAVNWLHEQNIMTGYPDGTFGGAKDTIKIELAVAFARAFDLFNKLQ